MKLYCTFQEKLKTMAFYSSMVIHTHSTES